MKKFLALGLALLLLAGCSRTTPLVENWVLAEEGVYTLSDGSRVDLWQMEQFHFWQLYKLSDGTGLLRENRPSGPENVYVGNQITFENLNETAQENILVYYQERGLLYDIPAELEKAYQTYQRCQAEDQTFDSFMVEQSIVPCGSNDTVCYYMTVLTSSYDVQLVNELRLCDAFQRDTGEKVEISDLFTVSQEELARWIADYYGAEEPLNAEMRAALQPEYLIFQDDHLDVMFPAGSLPSQEYSTGMFIAYGELEGMIYEWAVPTPQTN